MDRGWCHGDLGARHGAALVIAGCRLLHRCQHLIQSFGGLDQPFIVFQLARGGGAAAQQHEAKAKSLGLLKQNGRCIVVHARLKQIVMISHGSAA